MIEVGHAKDLTPDQSITNPAMSSLRIKTYGPNLEEAAQPAQDHQTPRSLNTALTQVVYDVQEELHVDLVGVHVLQDVARPAAEVVQVGAQVPACVGVLRQELLGGGDTPGQSHQVSEGPHGRLYRLPTRNTLRLNCSAKGLENGKYEVFFKKVSKKI